MKTFIKYFFAVTLLYVCTSFMIVKPAYSQPNSRALLIGINSYKNFPNNPTPGCEEDALETKKFIMRRYGFRSNEIRTLIGAEATASRIASEFRNWLISQTQPGDRVFFLYSGHGTRIRKNSEGGYDEAIAPYDADKQVKSLIRDKQFNELLNELSGRTVVMVFDSCHSGSITREISNKYARYLPLEKIDENQRDLKLVKDIPQIKRNAGIVVFSAAQANQQAFPIEISPGRYRGALSYAFTEMQNNDLPSLRDLKFRVENQFEEWQRSGRLPNQQQPVIEITSETNRISLEDQPLFGAAHTIQATVQGNPNTNLKIALRVVPGQNSFRINESFHYEVETNDSGYIYLLVFSEQNKATCLIPNPNLHNGQNNHLSPGRHRIPFATDESYSASPPIGKDIVVALFTKTQLDLGQKEEYSWDEIFSRMRDKNFFKYVIDRKTGVTQSLKQVDWHAVSLILERKN